MALPGLLWWIDCDGRYLGWQ